jgi:hypothetical protein
MIGTARPRVNFFMNKFKSLGSFVRRAGHPIGRFSWPQKLMALARISDAQQISMPNRSSPCGDMPDRGRNRLSGFQVPDYAANRALKS